MNPDKLRCAEAALRTVPGEYLALTPEIVAAVDNGHSFHRGMHVGWAWADAGRGWFLDFLSEHRMAGMSPAVPRRWDLRAPGDSRLHASGDGDAAKDAEI